MKPNILKTILLGLSLVLCACACFGAPSFLSEVDLVGATVVIASAVPAAVVLEKYDLKNLTVITQEEYQALKAKHRHLYVIDIRIDEEEQYQFIACRPSRNLLSAVSSAGNDVDKINDLIIKNMLLAGDEGALDDGLVYGTLMRELGQLMKLGQAFLSKA